MPARKLFRMNDHAARALQQRLDDDCGNLVPRSASKRSSFPRHSIWQVARVRPTGQCAQ